MNNLDLSLEIDRKKEYTKQVVGLLNIRIYEGINSIYKDAKEICRKERTTQYLQTFQKLLSTIPKWTKETISKEFTRIKIKSECSWLEELITAVFVSHTKVLTAIKGTNQFDLEIPTGSKFIHKCYIECARIFWKNPYLFSDEDISPCEYQRNLRDCENIISKTITETIRKMLPVENILKKYLGSSYRKQQSATDDDNYSIVTVITNEKENLKNLVKMDTSKLIKIQQPSGIESEIQTHKDTEIQESYQNYLQQQPPQNITRVNTNENNDDNNNENNNENNSEPSVIVEDLSTQDIHNSITKTQSNIDEINQEIDVLDNNLTQELSKDQMPPLPPPVSKPTQEVMDNLDNFVESIKQTQPIQNTYSINDTNSTMMSYSKTINSKINNLDTLSENTISGTRIKDKKDTLNILKNSEKQRKKRRRFNRYLFKK